MGRRKIEIKYISDDRNRSVTFIKRKNGLFKKAHELSILTGAKVSVHVEDIKHRHFDFQSTNQQSSMLHDNSQMSDLGDSDEDDEEEASGSMDHSYEETSPQLHSLNESSPFEKALIEGDPEGLLSTGQSVPQSFAQAQRPTHKRTSTNGSIHNLSPSLQMTPSMSSMPHNGASLHNPSRRSSLHPQPYPTKSPIHHRPLSMDGSQQYAQHPLSTFAMAPQQHRSLTQLTNQGIQYPSLEALQQDQQLASRPLLQSRGSRTATNTYIGQNLQSNNFQHANNDARFATSQQRPNLHLQNHHPPQQTQMSTRPQQRQYSYDNTLQPSQIQSAPRLQQQGSYSQSVPSTPGMYPVKTEFDYSQQGYSQSPLMPNQSNLNEFSMSIEDMDEGGELDYTGTQPHTPQDSGPSSSLGLGIHYHGPGSVSTPNLPNWGAMSNWLPDRSGH